MASEIKDCLLILNRSIDSTSSKDHSLVKKISAFFKSKTFTDESDPEMILVNDMNFGLVHLISKMCDKDQPLIKPLLISLQTVLEQLEHIPDKMAITVLNICIQYLSTCSNKEHKRIIYSIISESNEKMSRLSNIILVCNLTSALIDDSNESKTYSTDSIIVCKLLSDIAKKQAVSHEVYSHILCLGTLLLDAEIKSAEKKLLKDCKSGGSIVNTINNSVTTIFDSLDILNSDYIFKVTCKDTLSKLYHCLKKCITPSEKCISQKIYLKILNFFNCKMFVFDDFIMRDCAWLNDLLYKKFFNASFKQERIRIINNFYNLVSLTLMKDLNSSISISAINYFKSFFLLEFEKPVNFPLEIVHIQGFAYFSPVFKKIMSLNEFSALLSKAMQHLVPVMSYYIESDCSNSIDLILSSSVLIAEINSENCIFTFMLHDLFVKSFKVYSKFLNKENLKISLTKALFTINRNDDSFYYFINKLFKINVESICETSDIMNDFKQFWLFLLSLNNNFVCEKFTYSSEDCFKLSQNVFDCLALSILNCIQDFNLSHDCVSFNFSNSPISFDDFKPSNPKDIVLLSVTTEMAMFIFGANPKFLDEWFDRVLNIVIKLIDSNPLVCSLYEFMFSLLKISDKSNFFNKGDYSEDSDSYSYDDHSCKNVNNISNVCLIHISSFVEKLIQRIVYFKGKLFLSAFGILTFVPLDPDIVSKVIKNKQLFQNVLRMGISNISITKRVIVSLTKWSNLKLDLSDLVNDLVPYLKPFLSCNEVFSPDEDPNFVKGTVSEHVLFLILKICPQYLDVMLSVQDFSYNCYKKPFTKCHIPLPLSEFNVNMDLSEIIPRVINLLMTSLDKKIRKAACEIYHFAITYLLRCCIYEENSLTLTSIFKEILQPLILLSVDDDHTIYKILNPLMPQIARQLAVCDHSLPLVSDYFDFLISGISHSDLASVRHHSSYTLTEFFKHSFNLPQEKFDVSPYSVQKVLILLCSETLFRPENRILGEVMMYRIILDSISNDSLLLKSYFFPIFKHLMQCCHNLNKWSCELYLAFKSIQFLFLENSFLKVDFQTSFHDTLGWLLKYCNSSNHYCHSYARELFIFFSSVLENTEIQRFFSNCLISQDFLTELTPLFTDKNYHICINDMDTLNASLSFWHWLRLNCGVQNHLFLENNYTDSVICFIKLLVDKNFTAKIIPSCIITRNSLHFNSKQFLTAFEKSNLLIKILTLITDLMGNSNCEINFVRSVIELKEFKTLVEKLIFQPLSFYVFSMDFDFINSHCDLVSKIFKIIIGFPDVLNSYYDIFNSKVHNYFDCLIINLKIFVCEENSISIADLEAILIIKILNELSLDFNCDSLYLTSFSSLIQGLVEKVINLEQAFFYSKMLKLTPVFSQIYEITPCDNSSFLNICIDHIKMLTSNHLLCRNPRFTRHIVYYIVRSPAIICKLIDFCCSHSAVWFIEDVLSYCIFERGLEKISDLIVSALLKNAIYIENWGNECPENKFRVLTMIYYIVEKVNNFNISDPSFLRCIINFISSPEQTNQVLLLKFLGLFETDPHIFSQCLENVVSKYLITSSSNSNVALEYLALHSLLLILKRSGNSSVLIIFVKYIDFKSVILSDVKVAITSFLNGQSSEVQARAFYSVFEVFLDNSLTPARRLNIVKVIFSLFLNTLSQESIYLFYLKVCSFLYKTLCNKNLSSCNEANKIVTLYGAFYLILQLYEKIEIEQLVSNDSELVKSFTIDGNISLNKFLISSASDFQKLNSSLFCPENQSLLRELQCTVFKALIAVISKTQRNEDIFVFFLFSEDSSSGKYIWRQIIDSSSPIDFGKFTEKSKRHTTRVKVDFNYIAQNTEIHSSQTSSLISLSADDNSQTLESHGFDFTGNFSISSCLSHTKLSFDYDFDILNDHPLMMPMCKLIRSMSVQFISDSSPDSANRIFPPFMKKLILSLLQHNPIVVKSFLLKLVHNCRDVFKLFHPECLDSIVAVVIAKACGTTMNYFLFDIVEMILDWSSGLHLKSTPFPQKMVANKLLSFLININKTSEKKIFHSYIKLMESVVSKWNNRLEIPYSEVLNLLCSSNVDQVIKGVEIAIIFFLRSDKMFIQSEKMKFSDILLTLLENTKGKLFLRVAELNSLFLKKIIFVGGTQSLDYRDSSYVEKLDMLFQLFSKKNKLLFLNCLLIFQKQHKNLLIKYFDNFLKISFNTSLIQLHSKSLKLIRESIFLVDHFFLAVKFKEFDIFKDVFSISSNIALNRLKILLEFSKALPVQLVESFVSQITEYSKKEHPVGIRSLIYDIYIALDKRKKSFNVLFRNLQCVCKEIKINLLKGLYDKSNFIRDTIIRHLVTHSLPDCPVDVMCELFELLELPENEFLYIAIISRVMVEKFNFVAHERRIFPSVPIGKNLVEELPLASTEQSDLMALDSSFITVNSSISVDDDLILIPFKMSPTDIEKNPNTLESISPPDLLMPHYSSDLPCFAIKYSDLFSPLLCILVFDCSISGATFESFLAAFMSINCWPDKVNSMRNIVTTAFVRLFKSTRNFCIPLFSSISSIIVTYDITIADFKEEFFNVCHKCHLENTAIIVFEQILSFDRTMKGNNCNMNQSNDILIEDFIKLAFLYHYLDESETAIYISSIFCNQSLTDGFEAMSLNRWDKAGNIFKKLLISNGNSNFLRNLYTQSYHDCMIYMSNWTQLFQELSEFMFNHSYDKSFYFHLLPLLLKCSVLIHFNEKNSSDDYFHETLLKFTEINYFNLTSSIEICILSLQRNNIFLKTFIFRLLNYLLSLSNFYYFNSFTRKNQFNVLYKMLSEFILFNAVKLTDSDQHFLKYLMNSLPENESASGAFEWEQIINCRIMFIDEMLEYKSSDNLMKMAKVKWFSALFKNFSVNKNFHASRKYFLKLYELEAGTVKFKTIQLEMRLLKCDLELDLENKLNGLCETIKAINDLKVSSKTKVNVLSVKSTNMLYNLLYQCQITDNNVKLIHSSLNLIWPNKSYKLFQHIYEEFILTHIESLSDSIEKVNETNIIIDSVISLMKISSTNLIEMTDHKRQAIDCALIKNIFKLIHNCKLGYVFLPVLFHLNLLKNENKQLFKSNFQRIDSEKYLYWSYLLISKLDSQHYTIIYPFVLKLAREHTSKLKLSYFVWTTRFKNLPQFSDLNKVLEYSQQEINFLRSIRSLCHPTKLLLSYTTKIQNLIHEMRDVGQAFESMIEDCFYCESIFKGTWFKVNDIYKSHIFALQNYYMDDVAMATVYDQLNALKNDLVIMSSVEELKLEELCPYLANRMFNLNLEFQSITDPETVTFYKIFKISPCVKIISSLNYAVSLTVLDMDGKNHRWLISYTQDSRYLEALSKSLDLLNKWCRIRKLETCKQLYCVTPISPDVCIIEIPLHMTDLSSFMNVCLSDKDRMMRTKTIYDQHSWVIENAESSKSLISRYEELRNKILFFDFVRRFNDNVSRFPRSMLKGSLKLFGTYYENRKHFLKSYSFMSLCHWLFGTEINLSNVFVSFEDGSVLGIPLNFFYNTSTNVCLEHFIPMRLTPQIVSLHPINCANVIKNYMVRTFRSIDKDMLISFINIMAYSSTSHNFSNSQNWSDLIKGVKLRLNGQNPCKLFKQHFLAKYSDHGLNFNISSEDDNLTIEAQMECLVDLSKDDNILALLWAGSEPWL